MQNQPQTESERIAAQLADTQLANDTALAEVQREFGITWRAGTEYRATKRTRGGISGLDSVGQLEILCTDGVVAWFRQVQSGKLFQGHVDYFSGDVGPAFPFKSTISGAVEGKDSLRKRERRGKKQQSSPLEMALRVLNGLR